ncbi:1-(5-phosphoribosyl)-5-[(5-phosphoribosylamino)methylideneamino]imidazole-4-carboxamide isomerase [Leuconostoc gasicomitatum]|uniref:1-(5-phosphoribosyl)-5-[(5-phosphoribosylamino)methylideneamino] imidazole-4-carboxamide isomerase n=1 Tax=Leuconostoc gasicomitatum TaxID=115778 RepID=A0A9Q3SYR7_9LACO|nr:1-(5-phosphoribosyl)-5-[(5-phosphoribosylamino)methylideneamino]imidazole-4-carboxamide isomerase [Leuconostoc gasicomitatum]MBZ5963304.1 1-(5-phosphoribosyl)-5-[(5-phosphoribosylamino)methylideneamino]imidazole-4-carboxamide isomerase [Leuconostoc gasicomitatum]MBZ5981279.1 1-(5-phosphoribosyl)-5-[(5-phosphoribosylamino)methylideneamino]imidazole-4-carboxamide isomerase [Leuconostoc gasicomitatum]CUW20491.1 Phosphoribosylformimino-5-aminoimidazole carboxamide ribotide isomerase [Leuconostoc 
MILPAIDLLGGQSVRLLQGNYNAVTVVDSDPIAQAKKIDKAGLHALHVVDLDGAKSGLAANFKTILSIRQNFTGFLEVGGGIRTLDQIEQYYNAGINRVILGSVALKNPTLVRQAVEKYGELIAVGIDGKDGKIATEGWLEQSNISFETLLSAMIAIGVKHFIVTDVVRDGMLQGPNIDLLVKLQQHFVTANIIASGGIAQMSDLVALNQAGIQDIIVGKALASGSITLTQLAELEE